VVSVRNVTGSILGYVSSKTENFKLAARHVRDRIELVSMNE